MKHKHKPPSAPTRFALTLDDRDKDHIRNCARKMLDEPDRLHPPKKTEVVKWALAKAAEVAEG